MEKDRREFLGKFVTLSTVSLIFTGCKTTSPAVAVYGPPPASSKVAPIPSSKIDKDEPKKKK